MSLHSLPIQDAATETEFEPRSDVRAVAARTRKRQRCLIDRYRHEPELAAVVDRASTHAAHRVEQGPLDPAHTWVKVGHTHSIGMPVALHTAVGGLSDHPVPGDLLCAALASCTDSTIRVVANTLRLELHELSVEVDGEVDVRGALLVSPDVHVRFQAFRVRVHLRAAPGTSAERIERMLSTAEHSCIVLQTLRGAAPVTVEYDATALDVDSHALEADAAPTTRD